MRVIRFEEEEIKMLTVECLLITALLLGVFIVMSTVGIGGLIEIVTEWIKQNDERSE